MVYLQSKLFNLDEPMKRRITCLALTLCLALTAFAGKPAYLFLTLPVTVKTACIWPTVMTA